MSDFLDKSLADYNAIAGHHADYKPKRKRAKPKHNERDRVHVPFVKFLKAALDPKTQMYWHTANEGKVPVQYRMILKMMGLRKGVPDLFVVSAPVGIVAMEAKFGSNGLSEDQRAFREVWEQHFPFVVFRTPEEGEAALRALGVPLKVKEQGRAI